MCAFACYGLLINLLRSGFECLKCCVFMPKFAIQLPHKSATPQKKKNKKNPSKIMNYVFVSSRIK